MKKIIIAAGIAITGLTACNNSETKEPAATENTEIKSDESIEAEKRAKEIKDSTEMLDKKLADPNSKYSPDSLK